jgi:hypothetical protein
LLARRPGARVVATDVDSDGDRDMVLGGLTTLVVMVNDGAGYFQRVDTQAKGGASKMVAGDVDGDASHFGTTWAIGYAENCSVTGNGSAALGYFTAGTPANPYVPAAASTVDIFNNTISGTVTGTDPQSSSHMILAAAARFVSRLQHFTSVVMMSLTFMACAPFDSATTWVCIF